MLKFASNFKFIKCNEESLIITLMKYENVLVQYTQNTEEHSSSVETHIFMI